MDKTKKILRAKAKGLENKANKYLDKKRGNKKFNPISSQSADLTQQRELMDSLVSHLTAISSRVERLSQQLGSCSNACAMVEQAFSARQSSQSQSQSSLGETEHSSVAEPLLLLHQTLQRDVVQPIKGFLAGPAEAARESLAGFHVAAQQHADSKEHASQVRSRSKMDYAEVSQAEAIRDRDQQDMLAADQHCVSLMSHANNAGAQLEAIVAEKYRTAWDTLLNGSSDVSGSSISSSSGQAQTKRAPPPINRQLRPRHAASEPAINNSSKRPMPPPPSRKPAVPSRRSVTLAPTSSYGPAPGTSSYGPAPGTSSYGPPVQHKEPEQEMAAPPQLNLFTRKLTYELEDPTEALPVTDTEHQFRVRCGKQSFNLCIDRANRTISFGGQKYRGSAVQQVHKSRRHNCRLVMVVRGRQREKVMFSTPEERERFWELLWSIRGIPEKPDISVFASTWNMGEERGPRDFSEWLPAGHDLYVIGVQECEFLPDSAYNSVEADLFAQIERTLGPNYIKLAGKSLLSIRIVCIVHRQYISHVSNVHMQSVACGLGKKLGNKGGVAISLNFLGTRLLFVTGHFAAHMDKFEERNQDFRDVMAGLASKLPEGYTALNYYHAVFIFGDFNYRIENLDRDIVLVYIENGDLELLVPHDQLNRAKESGAAFYGFEEGDITSFNPSYRWEREIDEYSEEKMRVPSWCDRIMWRVLPGFTVKQESYTMATEVRTSDHRPVCGVFRVSLMKPNLPHVPLHSRSIRITDLKASGCVTSKGESISASVRFHSKGLLDPDIPEATRELPRQAEHSWNDSEVPMLVPVSSNLSFIAKQHLFFEVVHQLSSKKKRELIGTGAIPLNNAVRGPHGFTVYLCDNEGQYRGALSGIVSIQ